MAAPRFLWASVSVAILAIAASVCYLLLVALPSVQRRKDDLNTELAVKQVRDKQIAIALNKLG